MKVIESHTKDILLSLLPPPPPPIKPPLSLGGGWGGNLPNLVFKLLQLTLRDCVSFGNNRDNVHLSKHKIIQY